MYHRDLRQDIFLKEDHHYLNVPRVGTYAVYDTLDCTIECLSNPSCFSLNLAASKGADGKLWCELLSSEKYSNPGEYKRNESSHHFSIKVPLLFSFPPHTPIKTLVKQLYQRSLSKIFSQKPADVFSKLWLFPLCLKEDSLTLDPFRAEHPPLSKWVSMFAWIGKNEGGVDE